MLQVNSVINITGTILQKEFFHSVHICLPLDCPFLINGFIALSGV